MGEPSAMPAVAGANGSAQAPELRRRLQRRLEEARARAADDPFVDPVGFVGVDLFRNLRQRPGEVAAAEELVRALAVAAFLARARRLQRYLGETDPEANCASLAVLVDGLLDRAGEEPQQRAAVLRLSGGWSPSGCGPAAPRTAADWCRGLSPSPSG